MSPPLLLSLTALGAYLLGAVPFGYLVARSRGVDIFAHGSGNIGATNVGRVLGRRFGILVFLLDFAKGAVPVLVGRFLAQASTELPAEALEVTAGIAAFLGHLFPIYLRFHGGKGVATGAGIVVVLVPGPAVAALLTWLVVVASTRYVSLASEAAVVVLCLVRLGFTAEPWEYPGNLLTYFCLLGAALVTLRHRANLHRLLRGNENRLKESPAMLHLSKSLHVLALGLWFGSAVFFTFVVGLSLFSTFERLASEPGANRPIWFPLPAVYERERPSEKFPEPLRKEQGTRAAGAAVGPMFGPYFGLQLGCGLVAALTALSWYNAFPGRRAHRARAVLLVVALIGVGVGWWLEREVDVLTAQRNAATEVVLKASAPTPEEVRAAENARAEFGRWHGYSLMVNLTTLGLVTVAMALAARLPQGETPASGVA
jgi:acyl-phosphate glycerol 3-phosphate acyltransferase